jgi:hypothetical protein
VKYIWIQLSHPQKYGKLWLTEWKPSCEIVNLHDKASFG